MTWSWESNGNQIIWNVEKTSIYVLGIHCTIAVACLLLPLIDSAEPVD